MPHFIDPDLCINCGLCQPECPVPCITEGDNIRVIDQPQCIDCGSCAFVCPVGAISQQKNSNEPDASKEE